MNKYIKFLLFLLGTSYLLFSGCVEDPDMSGDIKNAKEPDVVLLTGSSDEYKIKRTATTITIQAEVTNANGVPVESYGICWDTKSNPTIESSKVKKIGDGLGQFKAVADNLEEDCVYYIRPFATNKKGTAYADEISISTTSGLGVVKTLNLLSKDIKATSAVCGGKIIDRGEGEIKERGILLSTKSEDITPKKYVISMDADSFYQVIPQLTPLTTYYVRAYVINSFGQFLGSEISFKTTDGKPRFTSFKLQSRDYASATLEAILDLSGEIKITESGFCFSETNKLPTTEDMKFVCTITNDSILRGTLQDLKQQTPYYVRAYAKNAFGISYTNGDALQFVVKNQAPTVTTDDIKEGALLIDGLEISGVIQDKGESDILDAGFCWGEVPEPTISNNKIQVYKGDSLISGIIPDLRGSKTYYVRAYATNLKATSYGQVKKIETPKILTVLPPYPGASVADASASVAYNIGYILGGDLGGKRSSVMYGYNAVKNIWQSKAPSLKASKGSCFVQLNSFSILNLGGIDDSDEVSDAFSYYSIENNNWRELDNSELKISLYDASAVSINNETFFFGGVTKDSLNLEIIKFTGWTESWSRIGYFPEKQFGSIAVSIGDSIIFVGLGKTGNSLSGDSYSKRLWSSKNMTTWNECAICPTEATGIVYGASLEDKIYVLDTNLDMWVFDSKDNIWLKKNTSFKSIIHADSLNSIFIFSINSNLYIGTTTGSKNFVKYSPLWDK